MNAMQHTPHGWTYDPSDMCVYSDMGIGICKIHRRVKIVGIDDLNSFDPSLETQANAALICIAPELVTRLYNLVNASVNAIEAQNAKTDEVILRLKEARETLKKVIQ
jgi:hypothetical protein